MGIEPAPQVMIVRTPEVEVASEADARRVDIGAGMLKGEGEPAKFTGQNSSHGFVVARRCLALVSPGQQEFHGISPRPHVQPESPYVVGVGGKLSGDHHVPTPEVADLDRGRIPGCNCIDAVEDQQPAGIGVEPVTHVLERRARLVAAAAKRQHLRKVGETIEQNIGRLGRNEKQRLIVFGIPVGVFDGGPGLAYSEQTRQRGDNGPRGRGGADKRFGEAHPGWPLGR